MKPLSEILFAAALLWHNRLVYDASQEVEARKTWVIEGPKAGSSLKPYGLLGPVRLSYQK